ncbi:MAG: nuclear transport factor 2 family protein [bacterium]
MLKIGFSICILVFGLIVGFLGGQLAAAEISLSPEKLKGISKKCLEQWLALLKQGDPDAIADLYDENGTLHPTFAPNLRRGDTLREYFTHFFLKKPEGKIIESMVQALTDVCHVDSGEYHFEIINLEGKKEIVEARFSFVFKVELSGTMKTIARFLSKFSLLPYIIDMENRKIYAHHSSPKPLS